MFQDDMLAPIPGQEKIMQDIKDQLESVIEVGDRFIGDLYDGTFSGTFEVVFVTKQNPKIVRVMDVETGQTNLIRLDDPYHNIAKV